MMTTENAAKGYKKADELAASAIKNGATLLKVRDACIEAIKWQYDYDKVELDAKDESIIQMDMDFFGKLQHVCHYKCAKIGDTYKCSQGKNFANTCNKKNCPCCK